MPGTLDYMKGEISRLQKELEEVKSESAGRRLKLREQKTEIDRLTTERTEFERKASDLESRVGSPDEKQQTIDKLTSELRTIKHTGSFRKLATEAGIDPRALDDAWQVLGLKAESDEPDEAAIRAAIDGAREGKAYLFKPAETTAATTPTPTPTPAFGGGRGKEAPGSLKLTRDQRRDATYLAANDDLIQRHRQAGTLVYE